MAAATMKTGRAACPDLEVIAAYLDHRLPERERAPVTEHLESCETCYFVFSESAQMRGSEKWRRSGFAGRSPRERRWWVRPAVLWPSIGGLAAAAVLIVAVTTVRPRAFTAEMNALVHAVGSDRVIEPRVTGGFRFGPYRGPARGAGSPLVTVKPDVRIAAGRLEKLTLGTRTTVALRSLGVSYLFVGNLDAAIGALEDAVNLPPADAASLSDLSAAYLARAARTGNGQDWTKALAAADRAVKAKSALTEAWFNRALALEGLSLAPETRSAWQEYLEHDPDSGWADEARDHLRSLR